MILFLYIATALVIVFGALRHKWSTVDAAVVLVVAGVCLIGYSATAGAAPNPTPKPPTPFVNVLASKLRAMVTETYAEQQDADVLNAKCSKIKSSGERYACRVWVAPNHGESATRVDRYRVHRVALVTPGTWDFLDGSGYFRLRGKQYMYAIQWPKPVPQTTASSTPSSIVGARWRSNTFTSPSGNIRCRYYPNAGAMMCATATPRRSVRLDEYTVRRGRSYLRRSGPVLRYGQQWSDGAGIVCGSYEAGMECDGPGGGFVISRSGVSTW